VDPVLVHEKGIQLLHNPLNNKGTAWPFAERDRLGLRGLVPPNYASLKEQQQRVLSRLSKISDPIEKFSMLSALQDRNETLFYSLIKEHTKEFAPIIYTPTVGEVCKNFSALFRRARGMYFSLQDLQQMNAMVYNWPEDQVEVIVVTDGSRILGLGDLGVQGMGIPIGKTALYVVGGGINPKKTMPVCLDVGTNNESLLNDPLYLGLRQKRITGQPFMEFVDEFIEAIYYRWPNALVQFEDFSNNNALPLLEKYRKKYLVFNDDIQGTGAVAAAGLLGALRVRGDSIEALRKERIVIVGAGSAGIGVANSISYTMVQELNIPPHEAFEKIYMVDMYGLIGRPAEGRVSKRPEVSFAQRPYLRNDIQDGLTLEETIAQVKPTILLGLSGQGGIFSEEAIKTMYKYAPKPIIFPMSNPTRNSECTAEDCYKWTEGNAIFASGSPFDPVTINGITKFPSQANNMFIFPGIGLAVTAINAKRLSYGMLNKAAIALSHSLTKQEMDIGQVYPDINRIRQVSLEIATTVAQHAYNLGLASLPKPRNIHTFLEDEMWDPVYADQIYVRKR